ncbi:MAG TPA: substrate-binding domain-containing protein [Acidothermaceae bacterium]|jgi:ABC-type phosphate transport system substrate-binding protein
MRKLRKSVAALGVVGTFAALVLGSGSAFGDDQPNSGDIVGVGSDTVQYASDFIADGDTAGHGGVNASGTFRDFSFFATGDGNGRALYDSSGHLLVGGNAGGASSNLQGTTTVVLRQGTKPVARPDGSGDGIGALTQDSVGGPKYEGLPNNSIQYARASRLPKGAEQTTCSNNASGCGGLHVFQFASDNLEIAKLSTGSNAVPLSIADLQGIYSCTITNWNQVPGNTSAPSNPIIAVLPQSGSGTRNFFLADLGTGGTSLAPGNCIVTAEEHDPTGITHATVPADAIEPFSVGRARLAQSGYFNNGPEPASDFAISLITGCTGVSSAWTGAGDTADQGFCGSSDTADPNQPANSGTPINAADGNPIYDSVRGLYFIVRDVDLTSTTPYQPGTSKNFAQVLFSGSSSFIAKSANFPLIRSAFLVPNYHDLGDASAG